MREKVMGYGEISRTFSLHSLSGLEALLWRWGCSVTVGFIHSNPRNHRLSLIACLGGFDCVLAPARRRKLRLIGYNYLFRNWCPLSYSGQPIGWAAVLTVELTSQLMA